MNHRVRIKLTNKYLLSLLANNYSTVDCLCWMYFPLSFYLLTCLMCFSHHWPQHTSVLFFNSLFFSIMARIEQLVHLPTVLELFRVVVYRFLDTSRQLHGSTCCFFFLILRRVRLSGTCAFGTSGSRPSLHSISLLPRFGSQNNIFSKDLFIGLSVITSHYSFLGGCSYFTCV